MSRQGDDDCCPLFTLENRSFPTILHLSLSLILKQLISSD